MPAARGEPALLLSSVVRWAFSPGCGAGRAVLGPSATADSSGLEMQGRRTGKAVVGSTDVPGIAGDWRLASGSSPSAARRGPCAALVARPGRVGGGRAPWCPLCRRGAVTADSLI